MKATACLDNIHIGHICVYCLYSFYNFKTALAYCIHIYDMMMCLKKCITCKFIVSYLILYVATSAYNVLYSVIKSLQIIIIIAAWLHSCTQNVHICIFGWMKRVHWERVPLQMIYIFISLLLFLICIARSLALAYCL